MCALETRNDRPRHGTIPEAFGHPYGVCVWKSLYMLSKIFFVLFMLKVTYAVDVRCA